MFYIEFQTHQIRFKILLIIFVNSIPIWFVCTFYFNSVKLQDLKKKLRLKKDTDDDETILQNTYDPEQESPRYTKNQRRENESTQKVNINNSKNETDIQTSSVKRKIKRELPSIPKSDDNSKNLKDTDAAKSEISTDGGTEAKHKFKKEKNKGDKKTKAKTDAEDTEDQLLHEYQQQIAEETSPKKTGVKSEETTDVPQNVTLNNDVGKKKKKKLKSVVTESDLGLVPMHC